MAIALAVFLIMVAIVCVAVAILAAGDPEGRGGKTAAWCLGGALLSFVLGVCSLIWL